jgi:squalene cyclase
MNHEVDAEAPPPPGKGVEEAVAHGVEFLANQQLSWGEFPSYQWSDMKGETPSILDSSPFVTTFVLYALSFVQTPAARGLIERGTEFLLHEQEAPGVWRYWSSRNPRTIDPDLDDTCCASFALRWLESPRFTPDHEAVILGNRAPSGLFKTWFRDPGALNDLDSVVNANVLLYLGERPETSAACELINQIINRGMERATYYYYLDPLALYYTVSRAYLHGVHGFGRSRDAVVGKILARQRDDGEWESELLTGLAICTLCNFGLSDSPDVARGARHLIRRQRPDGSWGDHLFYAGPEPPAPHSFWWSSPALAAALCLEALSKAGSGDQIQGR